MSQADPGSSPLAGCSHQTRLNQSVQVAYPIGEFNTRIQTEGKKNTWADLIWGEMDDIFGAAAQKSPSVGSRHPLITVACSCILYSVELRDPAPASLTS